METISLWFFILLFVLTVYALNKYLNKKLGKFAGNTIIFTTILFLYVLEKTDYSIGKKIGYYLNETISKPIPKPRPKDK